MVHAHDLPSSNPQAITKETRPKATKPPPINTEKPPNMSSPIMPDIEPKKKPTTIATIPDMISKTAKITTPIGLIFWEDSTRSLLRKAN